MTWPDIIASVTSRIHDERARARELRVLYREEIMPRTEALPIFVMHCRACCWDSLIPSDEQPVVCLHCGDGDIELREVRRNEYSTALDLA